MYQILQITDDAFQKQTLILADGTKLDLTIYFMPMQQIWVITELVYGNITINGLRISNSPNIIHQFINKLPFGLACISKNKREPQLQDDFLNGNSVLYILTEAETQQYLQVLTGG